MQRLNERLFYTFLKYFEYFFGVLILKKQMILKRQEKEKEQLIRELTQNNTDLKQFSYITSHNLRAPLSNLSGLLTLLDDMPIDNPELQAILGGFKKSTDLLNETVNDLVKVIIIKDSPSIQREEVQVKDVFENDVKLDYCVTPNRVYEF